MVWFQMEHVAPLSQMAISKRVVRVNPHLYNHCADVVLDFWFPEIEPILIDWPRNLCFYFSFACVNYGSQMSVNWWHEEHIAPEDTVLLNKIW